MELIEKESYVLINTTEDVFVNFFTNFEESYSKLKEKHLIIQLSENLNIVEENILVFLKYAEQHQKGNATFIVITSKVDVDNFPETFNIVPTLKEAEDVLEMENLQRDLGF